MAESFHNRVRLSSTERSKLLCRLDEAPAEQHGRDRRRWKRWEYRMSDIALVVQHPGGGNGRYLVCARNLSAGGISFIHGGYLHPGSDCKVVLPRRDGTPWVVAGVIVHCRHLQGSHHEVGLQFVKEVDPTFLLPDPVEDDEGTRDQTLELPTLEGNVLVIDQSSNDRRLLTHQLRATGITLQMVEAPGLALDAIRQQAFELVLCDLNLEDDAVRMIGNIRALDFKGPILVITAEHDPKRLIQARTAGANEIIGKPANPIYLAALLAEWLRVPAVDRPVFSTLEDKPGMVELIADFIEDAHRKAGLIEKGVTRADLSGLRELCLSLAGSAAGHGFAPLTEAARDALTALDTTTDSKDSQQPLRRVVSICRRLRCQGSARPIRDGWGDKSQA